MKLRRLSRAIRVAILVCLLFSQVFSSSNSKASPDTLAPISVNTFLDEKTTGDGLCSLREAVISANTDTAFGGDCQAGSGSDIILLSTGTYALSIPGIDEEGALAGDLDVYGDVIITGKGTDKTFIDGNQIDRIFHIFQNTGFPAPVVKLYQVTVQNGHAYDLDIHGGGGILIDQGEITIDHARIQNNQADYIGGGIDNAGTLYVNYTTIQNNSAARSGGGIQNVSDLWLSNTAVLTNTTNTFGGGVTNRGSANITNVTFSGNEGSSGGALYNATEILNIFNTTFSGNTSAIFNTGKANFANTIVANSTGGSNCIKIGSTANFGSDGFNIEDSNTCQFIHVTDRVDTPPILGKLADNGGVTLSMMPQIGSPAIDPENNIQCPLQDQRGFYRPGDGNNDGIATCDIGAMEVNAKAPIFVYLPVINRK